MEDNEYTEVLEKSQQKTAIVFIISILSLATMIFWYLIFEKPPLNYENSPFHVIGGPFKGGDTVTYIVKKCNNNDQIISYIVTQGLKSIDGNYILGLGSTAIISEPGCKKSISHITVLPKNLSPGTYQIIGRSEVPGTVKMHFVPWETEVFVVN